MLPWCFCYLFQKIKLPVTTMSFSLVVLWLGFQSSRGRTSLEQPDAHSQAVGAGAVDAALHFFSPTVSPHGVGFTAPTSWVPRGSILSRQAPIFQPHVKPLFTSRLLKSHQPKQVTQSRSESWRDGSILGYEYQQAWLFGDHKLANTFPFVL